jgi:6-phosphogluconate dehydrogenase (decarboxylating)
LKEKHKERIGNDLEKTIDPKLREYEFHLSKNEKNVAVGFAESGSVAGAARQAGVTYTTAKKILSRDKVKDAVLTAMYDRGLTVEFVSDKIKELMEAEDVVIDREGSRHSVPNNAVRHKAVETAIKLLGIDTNQAPQTEKNVINAQILNVESPEAAIRVSKLFDADIIDVVVEEEED